MWDKLRNFVTKKLSFRSSRRRDHSCSPTSVSAPRSSSSGFLNRSFSCVLSTPNTCSICLGSLKSGKGQAIFTAECSHSFHFNCIATSVNHGNRFCPLCRANWKDVPFQAPSSGTGKTQVSPMNGSAAAVNRQNIALRSPRSVEPQHFSDDEPILISSANSSSQPQFATIKTFSEFSAVTASDSFAKFPVLVRVRAPPLHSERAPIDLVCVLDISASMSGSKLQLLKRAMHFVIQNLGPSDRLSIVTFSTSARRIFPLRRMYERGSEDATSAVDSLLADGNTNIADGLKKGVRVLEERRQQNPVASIILLSDGKDNQHLNTWRNGTSSSKDKAEFLKLLPASIRSSSSIFGLKKKHPTIPVHAFGFGTDHDSTVMHAISDGSCGTFSFIESISIIQDAFAMCIGGLLSVVAQDFQLKIDAASPGVKIGSIPSGKYRSEISDKLQQGIIDVGSLYAEEEKDFLVYLTIPEATEGETMVKTTSLLDVSYTYKDLTSKKMVQTKGERVVIERPNVLSHSDVKVCLEVDRQRNRLLVAEGIAEAQQLAEAGKIEEAQAVLESKQSVLLSSASALAGDSLCSWLEAELKETKERMKTRASYEHTGRAYALSGLSSHSWQRATARGDTTSHTIIFSAGGSTSISDTFAYETPSMVHMVSKSRALSAASAPEHSWHLSKSSSLHQ